MDRTKLWRGYLICRRNESRNRQPSLSDAEAAAACCANLVPVDFALGGYPASVRSHSCILFGPVGYNRDITHTTLHDAEAQ